MKNKKEFNLMNTNFLILEEYKDCFNVDEFKEYYTDYFYEFDYILGDYSYNKLRLKGFYEETNKRVKQYNNIKQYKQYLKEYCANEAPYFLLEKKKEK